MEAIDVDDEGNRSSCGGQKFSFPSRYVLAIMGFLCFDLINSTKLSMSLTIVAMVNSSISYTNEGEQEVNRTTLTVQEKAGEFQWDRKEQGIVLGAYFLTFGVSCAFGGWLCQMIGSKKVLGFGTLFTGLLNLAIPSAARHHWRTLTVVRALEGISQGLSFPAFVPLIRKWIPASRRSTVLSILNSGLNFGSFTLSIVSGYLCDSEFLGGWPSVYYLYGILGCAWSLFSVFLIYDSPLKHPRISKTELHWILESNQHQFMAQKSPSIPWKAIYLSPVIWASYMASIGVRWALNHFDTVHPTYMATILKYPIVKDGVFSSLSQLCMLVTILITGFISDYARKRKCVSISVVYKSCVTVGLFGYILCVLGVIQAGQDTSWNTVLLIVALGFTGIAFTGDTATILDLSPHFSGVIFGIGGMLFSITGFIIPSVIGALTEHEQTMAQWNVFFYISIAVTSTCAIVYDILGSAAPQPWDPEEDANITPKT